MIKMPDSTAGKWSVGFGVAAVVVTALSVLLAVAIKGDPAVIENSLFLTILSALLSITLTLAAPLSLLVGIFAVARTKEWLVLKYLAVLYGLTLLLFLLGEFLFPH
jgi:hypothetical protein